MLESRKRIYHHYKENRQNRFKTEEENNSYEYPEKSCKTISEKFM